MRKRTTQRGLIATAFWFVPALVVLAIDVVQRRAQYAAMLRADAVALVVTWMVSGALWTCAVVASASRRRFIAWPARFVLALLGAVVALQTAAYEYFGTTIDHQLLESAWRLDGMSTLARPFIGTIIRWTSTGALLAVAWSFVVKRTHASKRRASRRAFVGMAGALVLCIVMSPFLPVVATDGAPVAVGLGAFAKFLVTHPKRGTAAGFIAMPEVDFTRSVAPLPEAEPRALRNVVFVLTESVRASAVCSAHLPECPHNPFSNDAAPDRLPLERMRAVDSFTLLSFGVLFTGLPVSAPKDDWLRAPLVFDYAHAAHVTTAYWTAHHPGFANSHEWTDHAAIDRLAWGTDFDPRADKVLGADDAEVIDRAASEIPTLREPFFAVVHLAGTHFPYRIDDDAPFRPLGASVDRREPSLLRNRYYDAIYRQDKLVAKLVGIVRNTKSSARTVIVFLSDHGESFFEHGSVLHGSSLWDEELRVPAWIDAPAGSLTPRELASLRDLRDVPVTQVDVAPTLLDLLQIADVPAWAPEIARMKGASLLRSPAHVRETDIATCNALWSCFVPSSGKLIGDSKWVTRPPDPYRCFDTRADPTEQNDLGAAACSQ